jgi:hypothetical protein
MDASRVLATAPPTWSISQASSNGSTPERLWLHRSRQWLAGCALHVNAQGATAIRPREGARLVVECVQRANYQAFRIVSMDESTAIHPAQTSRGPSASPDQRAERAQVKWFNDARLGFLTGRARQTLCTWTLRRFGMTEPAPANTCWCGSGQDPRV